MTLTPTETTDDGPLELRAQRLIDAATSDRELAAAQALVEEETIISCQRVQHALGLRDTLSGANVRWEGLAGQVYSLGLDDEQRTFLGLTLSMMGIGSVGLAAVANLDERRLAVMLRAIARLAGNHTLAVGRRV
ncbi:hypothetical protein [Streptomyces sp. NBC_00645]|uniref:hypothetical protein n=1 Tax=Streptomyces sp. NBC_00645 TaxID=2975795 RepID=UPI003245DCD5